MVDQTVADDRNVVDDGDSMFLEVFGGADTGQEKNLGTAVINI